jgi:hypothetical protein
MMQVRHQGRPTGYRWDELAGQLLGRLGTLIMAASSAEMALLEVSGLTGVPQPELSLVRVQYYLTEVTMSRRDGSTPQGVRTLTVTADTEAPSAGEALQQAEEDARRWGREYLWDSVTSRILD